MAAGEPPTAPCPEVSPKGRDFGVRIRKWGRPCGRPHWVPWHSGLRAPVHRFTGTTDRGDACRASGWAFAWASRPGSCPRCSWTEPRPIVPAARAREAVCGKCSHILMLVASGPPAVDRSAWPACRLVGGVERKARRVWRRGKSRGALRPCRWTFRCCIPLRAGRSGNLSARNIFPRAREALPRQCGRGSSGTMLLLGVWSRQASGSAPGELLLRPGGSKSWYCVRSADLRVACLSKAFLAPYGAWTVPVPTTARHSLHLRFAWGRSEDLSCWFSDTACGHRCRPDRPILFRAISGVYS